MAIDERSDGNLVTETCNNCGETFRIESGAMSTCWKCGTPLAQIDRQEDSSSDDPAVATRGQPTESPVVVAQVVDTGDATPADSQVPENDDSITILAVRDHTAQTGQPQSVAADSLAEPDSEIVMAEVVATPGSPFLKPPVENTSQNGVLYLPDSRVEVGYPQMAAVGGSVGAVVLGVMALLGALITPASVVTAVLGLMMGLWGLSSPKRRMAIIGIAICFLAVGLCFVQVL